MLEKATQFGGVLKSAKSKNVANGLKASEKVRKGRKASPFCRPLSSLSPNRPKLSQKCQISVAHGSLCI